MLPAMRSTLRRPIVLRTTMLAVAQAMARAL
jgi:hypothetical protein